MALEDMTGADKFISALVPANPVGSDDTRDGDNHIRGIKNVLRNTFPNVDGPVSLTDVELNTPKVSRAGDTMTGPLMIEGSFITISGNGPNGYNNLHFTNDSGIQFVVGVGGSTAAGWSQNKAGFGTFGASPIGFATNNIKRMEITGAGVINDGAGIELGWKNIPRQDIITTWVLGGPDGGKCYAMTTPGGTVSLGSAAPGISFYIYNENSGPMNVGLGAGLADLILAGTNTSGPRTLAPHSIAFVWYSNAATAVISGQGVT